MKKSLLLVSASALAAGLVAARAQSNIYSANVVGYVSVVYAPNGQFTMLANPFDDGNGNISTNILDSANSLPTKSQILTWNTNSQTFSTIQKTASGWPSTVSLPPGTGFFVRNGNTGGFVPPITNTFFGSVICPVGQSITNHISAPFTLVGSMIPYAGNLAIATQPGGDIQFNLNTLPTKSQILTWNAASQTYNVNQKTASGWPSTTTIAPADGFFINNKGGPFDWVETLNPGP